MTVYLDNASSTVVCPEAVRKAGEIMTENYANPSSSHAFGRLAKKALEEARRRVAEAAGAEPDEIFFTSGGTESNNWAVINGALGAARRGKHIISSGAEHDSVRKSLDILESRGFEITRAAPRPDGSISPETVMRAVRDDTILISLMLVNNETGAITDVAGIFSELRRRNPRPLLHTDAVQAFLKLPLLPAASVADLMSLSAHKIHAPKGVGALFIRKGVKLPPLIVGGEQESSRRAGTESLPLICAFGEAARLGADSAADSARHMYGLRDRTVSVLKRDIPGLIVIGGGAPHILSISLPGFKSEVIMNFLESKSVYVSKSSACKKGGRSHVLEAMGLPGKVTDGALRISFSRFTSPDEVDILCQSLKEACAGLFTSLS